MSLISRVIDGIGLRIRISNFGGFIELFNYPNESPGTSRKLWSDQKIRPWRVLFHSKRRIWYNPTTRYKEIINYSSNQFWYWPT